jgi:hypothetical protein
MAGHQITVTGKTGPNRTNTALVIDRVEKVLFDLEHGSLQVEQAPPTLPFPPVPPGPTVSVASSNIKEYDLVGVTTVTCTVTAGVYAFVVS